MEDAMKQLKTISIVSLFLLLSIGCLGLSMLAYQESSIELKQTAMTAPAKMTKAQKAEYQAELNALYLRNQFI